MRGVAIAFVVAGLAGGACVVDLDHVLACGDGYVDALAGEECDPNVPESFERACEGTSRPFGQAVCDPDTCELLATELQCAHCGDGIIDVAAGEECDGSNIGAVCPGEGQPTCSLNCTIDLGSCDACGNGEKDVGEECDPMEGGGLVVPRLCAGDDPLDPPHAAKPYASGTAVSCTSSCEYDRRGCGYCGDGVQDPARQLSRDGSATSLPEVCDGEDFDDDEVADEDPYCAAIGARANVTCDADCLGFTPRGGDQCCVPSGAACTTDGDAWRCCSELADPDGGEACLPVLSPGHDDDDGGETTPRLCR